MIYTVRAHPGSHEEKIEVVDGTTLEVWVNEPPEKGLANRAVERMVAAHLKIPKSLVSVIRGTSSRNKLVKVG